MLFRSDRSGNLADVVRVAAGTAHADVEDELLLLRSKLQGRPRDYRAVITRLAESLDAITARQRLIDHTNPGGDPAKRTVLKVKLDQTRTGIEERLQIAYDGQHRFDRWAEVHEPELTRLAVLSATKLALDHQQGLVRTSGLPERSAGAEIG